MKRIATITTVVLCVLSMSAAARQDEPLRSISVSGTVETKVAPDLIVWSISLTDTDKDMRKAKEMNDAKIESVIALREKLDVGDGDIETGTVSIRREFERVPQGGRGEFKHFVVNRYVTIRQRDLKRFDEFLDAFVSSAEMEVNFQFESSKMMDVRAETRLKALQIAKEKAQTMAEVAGAKLGKVITINEHAQRSVNPMSNASIRQGSFTQSTPGADLATDTFIPGAMRVQMTVYATFELE